jgi:hypothetical protein
MIIVTGLGKLSKQPALGMPVTTQTTENGRIFIAGQV